MEKVLQGVTEPLNASPCAATCRACCSAPNATKPPSASPIPRGGKHRVAQQPQWVLSESTWSPADLHQTRLAVLHELPLAKPAPQAVLIADETGDRKYGTHTVHIGRHYLDSLGKVDCGVVCAFLGVDEATLAFMVNTYEQPADKPLPRAGGPGSTPVSWCTTRRRRRDAVAAPGPTLAIIRP